VGIGDAETLERMERVNRPAAMPVSAIIGSVRLIDHIIIGRDQE
jgi:pantothenate synthetase